MSLSAVVSILLAYLLQAAAPHKDEARRYLKDKLSGWKERVALGLFDVAWDLAFAAYGKQKLAGLSAEQADAFVAYLVDADKEMSA